MNRSDLTKEQRRTLHNLEMRILRAFPASPYQAELKKKRLKLLESYGFNTPEKIGYI